MFLLPHLLSQFTDFKVVNPTVRESEVVNKTNSYAITIKLPGAQQEDVQVELNEDVLSVELTPKPADEVGDRSLLWSEFETGAQTFHYRLPRGLNHEQISATLNHGVLTIEVGKLEAQKRVINVNQTSEAVA